MKAELTMAVISQVCIAPWTKSTGSVSGNHSKILFASLRVQYLPRPRCPSTKRAVLALRIVRTSTSSEIIMTGSMQLPIKLRPC